MQQKYNEICDKISKIIKKGLGSEHVYNDKYLKTKIKFYKYEIKTYFYANSIPSEKKLCVTHAIII